MLLVWYTADPQLAELKDEALFQVDHTALRI